MANSRGSNKRYELLTGLGSLDQHLGEELIAFAVLQSAERRQTQKGRPFYDLGLADQQCSIAGKIWDDAPAAMATMALIEVGTAVKLICKVGHYKGTPQLTVRQIRPAEPGETGYDAELLFGKVPDWLPGKCCRTLVFDIETVPAHDIRAMPPTIVKALTAHAQRREMEQDAAMGLSPFFGRVVSLAFGDGERDPHEQEVTVLIVPPNGHEDAVYPDWIRPMTERELLLCFWSLASHAEVVVTFNGRGFDVPFLATRSLIHKIPARVDLLSNRWSLRPHLDLLDILEQRGRGPANLDVVCWALGITSPKGEMDGSMVAPAYQRGEIEAIATYNREDVRATTQVFQQTRDNLLRFRPDW